MTIAVIPARRGSKRIPNKNIRHFCGEPIIAYSIRSALASTSIDTVWVSTEDEETAEIARHYGAQTPFLRPSALADDFTVLKDIMGHAIQYACSRDLAIEHFCLIFATAPLIDSDDIDRGYCALQESGADMALSVTEFRSAPQRAQFINEEGLLEYNQPECYLTRTQDLTPLYHDAAQFVWGKSETFSRVATELRVAPVLINAQRVVDIDTPADWDYAEYLYQTFQTRSQKQAA